MKTGHHCRMDDPRDFDRVLWRSRRGMLELDLLLVDFARARYPGLAEAAKQAYRELLNIDDWVVLDWLRERAAPDPAFAEIVAAIKSFNHQGNSRHP